MERLRSESQSLQRPACLSRTASSPSPSSDNNNFNHTLPAWTLTEHHNSNIASKKSSRYHNLELQLLTTTTSSSTPQHMNPKEDDENHSTQLQLSIGSSSDLVMSERNNYMVDQFDTANAMAEKAYAEEARREAKWQIELAEQEFANAQRIRQQAQAELDKAKALKDHATKQISSTILQITCHACKQQFKAIRTPHHENYMSLSPSITQDKVHDPRFRQP